MVDRRHSRFVVAACVGAVALWSLKPIAITVLGPRLGYVEAYLASAMFGTTASLLVASVRWREIRRVASTPERQKLAHSLLLSAVSGVFLAAWYFGFYRALYAANKVDATIISFTWPLLAVFAMRIFAPSHAGRKLGVRENALILLAFAGACGIALSASGDTASPQSSTGLVWAVLAAFGSGLYLPFAIRAGEGYFQLGLSRPIATFYTISVANACAMALVLSIVVLDGIALDWSRVDAVALTICAGIGIATYVMAEVAWTWAFQEVRSLSLAALPYFSPAISVLLLWGIFNEPVRGAAMIGLVVVLVSNLALHFGPPPPAKESVHPQRVGDGPAHGKQGAPQP